MLVHFIVSSVSATHWLCSELYRYEPLSEGKQALQQGEPMKAVQNEVSPKGIPTRYTKKDKEDKGNGEEKEDSTM